MSLLLALTAAGGTDATAAGVTVTEVYSLLAGTATGQSNATASSALVSEVYSLIAGAATGQSNSTATDVGYPSDGVRKQRQRRRRKLLERIQNGNQPPLDVIEEEISHAIETAKDNPDQASETYSILGAYLTAPQFDNVDSSRIMEMLSGLEQIRALIQGISDQRNYEAIAAQLAFEEEEMMIIMALA